MAIRAFGLPSFTRNQTIGTSDSTVEQTAREIDTDNIEDRSDMVG
ncbi:hypothetical protein [Breoghania sp.]|nr:hypothetical protein [Breoghania sp.]MDJ0932714.1 hypothetical protein [Breoghania sp.]